MSMFCSHEMDFCQYIYLLKTFDSKLICLRTEFQKHVQYKRIHQSITSQFTNQSIQVNSVFLSACFICKRHKFCVIFKDKIRTYIADWVLMDFRGKAVQQKEVYFPMHVTRVKFLCYLGRYFIGSHNVIEKPVTHKNSNFVIIIIFV